MKISTKATLEPRECLFSNIMAGGIYSIEDIDTLEEKASTF